MSNGITLVTQSSCGWIVKSSSIIDLPFMGTLKRVTDLSRTSSKGTSCKKCSSKNTPSELFRAFCTDIKRVKGTPNEKVLLGALQKLMRIDFPTRWKIIDGSTIIELG